VSASSGIGTPTRWAPRAYLRISGQICQMVKHLEILTEPSQTRLLISEPSSSSIHLSESLYENGTGKSACNRRCAIQRPYLRYGLLSSYRASQLRSSATDQLHRILTSKQQVLPIDSAHSLLCQHQGCKHRTQSLQQILPWTITRRAGCPITNNKIRALKTQGQCVA
jgi:hypothetical protein